MKRRMQNEYKRLLCLSPCDGICYIFGKSHSVCGIPEENFKSFLAYVPYAVLGAMTFPAIFTSTGSVISAVVGCVVAVCLAFKEKSLLTVALSACGAVLVVELVQMYMI